MMGICNCGLGWVIKIKRLGCKIRRRGIEWAGGDGWIKGRVRVSALGKEGGRTWPKGLIVQGCRGLLWK